MADKNDGGPAFPIPEHKDGRIDAKRLQTYGMTLRDYFAAKAMQGMLAESGGKGEVGGTDTVVGRAYIFADAMLNHRDK